MEQLFAPIKSQVSELVPRWFTSHLRQKNSSHPVFPVPTGGWTMATTHLAPVFFFGVDPRWMIDEAAPSRFPLIFGFCVNPRLSAGVVGGFCSDSMCFCHSAMRDSLLVLAQYAQVHPERGAVHRELSLTLQTVSWYLSGMQTIQNKMVFKIHPKRQMRQISCIKGDFYRLTDSIHSTAELV